MTEQVLTLDTPRRLSRRFLAALWVTGTCYLALVAVAFVLAPTQLSDLPSVVFGYAFATSVIAGTTALLLYLHAHSSGRRGYLWLGGTFAYLSGLMVLFPFVTVSVVVDGERIAGGPQSRRILFYMWNLAFAVGIAVSAYVLASDRRGNRRPGLGRSMVASLVTVGVALALSTMWVTVGSSSLPRVLDDGSVLTPVGRALDVFVLVLSAIAAVVCVWGSRSGSRIGVWLAAVGVLQLGDAVVSMNTPALFTAGFYYNRAFGFMAYSALLILLIWDLAAVDRAYHVMAATDELTGIGNRHAFRAALERELAQAQNAGGSLAVLWIDLDGFKAVNDLLGHAAGDELLRTVGGRIRATVRGADHVARLGGDEFGVVLSGHVSEELARSVARRVVASVGEAADLGGGAHRPSERVFVTASVGIAMFPDDATSVTDLLQVADLAMYEAKREGGDRIRRAPSDVSSLDLAAAARRRRSPVG